MRTRLFVLVVMLLTCGVELVTWRRIRGIGRCRDCWSECLSILAWLDRLGYWVLIVYRLEEEESLLSGDPFDGDRSAAPPVGVPWVFPPVVVPWGVVPPVVVPSGVVPPVGSPPVGALPLGVGVLLVFVLIPSCGDSSCLIAIPIGIAGSGVCTQVILLRIAALYRRLAAPNKRSTLPPLVSMSVIILAKLSSAVTRSTVRSSPWLMFCRRHLLLMTSVTLVERLLNLVLGNMPFRLMTELALSTIISAILWRLLVSWHKWALC